MNVTFDQRINVDAQLDTVWALLTDPSRWPQWFPDMDSLSGGASATSGSSFQFTSDGKPATGSVVDVDENARKIKFVVDAEGQQTTHTFDVDRAGGVFGIGGNDARVQYTYQYDPPGGVLGDFVASGNPRDALKVKHTLERIKNLVEG